MSIKNLPQEILDTILSYAGLEFKSRLACRLWNSTIMRAGYENRIKTIEKMVIFQETIEMFGFSNIVKYVNIDIRLKGLSEEQIILLLSFVQWLGANCKNIKTFKIHDLMTTHMDSELAAKLWDTVKKEKWKLEETGETSHMAMNNQGYFSTLLAFAESATTAQVSIYKTPKEKKLIFDPAKFPNLRNLVANAVGFKRIYELDGYISPRLTSVTLCMVTFISGSNEFSRLTQNITNGDMSGIEKCTNIEKIKYNGPLNEQGFKYISYKFPRLEDVEITVRYSNEDTQDLPTNTINELGNYVANIKKVSIYNIAWPRYAESIKSITEKAEANNVKAERFIHFYKNEDREVDFEKKQHTSGIDLYAFSMRTQDIGLLNICGAYLTELEIENLETGLTGTSIIECCPNVKSVKLHEPKNILDIFPKIVKSTIFAELALDNYTPNSSEFEVLSKRLIKLKTLKVKGKPSGSRPDEVRLESILNGFKSAKHIKVAGIRFSLPNLLETGENIILETIELDNGDIDIFNALPKYFKNLSSIQCEGIPLTVNKFHTGDNGKITCQVDLDLKDLHLKFLLLRFDYEHDTFIQLLPKMYCLTHSSGDNDKPTKKFLPTEEMNGVSPNENITMNVNVKCKELPTDLTCKLFEERFYIASP